MFSSNFNGILQWHVTAHIQYLPVILMIVTSCGILWQCSKFEFFIIGKTTMAIVTLMPYKWVEEWAHARVMKRGDEYEAIKKTFGHKAVEQACHLYPDIKVRPESRRRKGTGFRYI